jgi:hypothetical protein
MKTYRRVEVNGQLLARAIFFILGEGVRSTRTEWTLGGPWNRSEIGGEEKSLCPAGNRHEK